MGKRIDVVLLIGPAIFVLEFKVGESQFTSYAIDQVWDYALDLKNFHESSYNCFIAPILIATKVSLDTLPRVVTSHADKVLSPIKSNVELLGLAIERVLDFSEGPILMLLSGSAGDIVPLQRLLKRRWRFIVDTRLPKFHGVMQRQ